MSSNLITRSSRKNPGLPDPGFFVFGSTLPESWAEAWHSCIALRLSGPRADANTAFGRECRYQNVQAGGRGHGAAPRMSGTSVRTTDAAPSGHCRHRFFTLCGADLRLRRSNRRGRWSTQPSLNYFGLPGLIDTPTATAMTDGELGVTVGYFADQTRVTLAFQVLPRVTATLRYSTRGGAAASPPIDSPPVAGLLLRPQFRHPLARHRRGRLVAGRGRGHPRYRGHGRLRQRIHRRDTPFRAPRINWPSPPAWLGPSGPAQPLGRPFGTRAANRLRHRRQPSISTSSSRGDAAFFGGIEWQATDRLRLQVEYSSDLYRAEVADGLFSVDSPVNIGATYRIGKRNRIAGAALPLRQTRSV